MKKDFKLVWKDKNLSDFMKSHGFSDSDELTMNEFKKLVFSVINSFLEKKIDSEKFLELAFSLWSPSNESDDKDVEELKDISYLLSELSYGIDNTLEEHHPQITKENKDNQVVYEYNGYLNEILRYYIDHNQD